MLTDLQFLSCELTSGNTWQTKIAYIQINGKKNHLFFKRRQSMQITEMALSSREKYFIVSSKKFQTFFLFQLSFKWLEVRRIHSTNSCIFKIENAWNILDSKWVKYKVLFKYWFKISFPLFKLHICNETDLVIVWNLYINKLWSVQEKKIWRSKRNKQNEKH